MAVLGLLLLGCAERDPNLPDLVTVGGTVTLDGNLLSGADVQFTPVGSTLGTHCIGRTDAEGRYVLVSIHNDEGAAVGEFEVTISKLVRPDGSEFPPDFDGDMMQEAHQELLHPSYSTYEHSTLKATVPPGGKKDLNFDLKSMP